MSFSLLYINDRSSASNEICVGVPVLRPGSQAILHRFNIRKAHISNLCDIYTENLLKKRLTCLVLLFPYRVITEDSKGIK